MSPRAHIRLATEQDLPRLIELLAQLPLDPETPPPSVPLRAFHEVAADPRQQLFVIEAGGSVVGTACLLIMPNLTHDGRPYAIVENVVVDETSRRGGYGAQLMRHIMEQARLAGCYKLALTSNEQRLDAHRFYERLGFRSTQRAFRIDFD
jgi:GNAT superfamily N-acetyltransferase